MHFARSVTGTVILTCLVFACAEEARDRPMPAVLSEMVPVERVALHPMGERTRERKRTVRSLYPPKDVSPWEVQAQRSLYAMVQAGQEDSAVPGFSLQDGTPSVPALVVVDDSEDPNRVLVPGDYDPASFNEVRLRITCPEPDVVRVVARRSGRALVTSEPHDVEASKVPTTVRVPLPGLRRLGAAFDELALEIEGRAQGIMVVQIDLVARPLAEVVLADGGDGGFVAPRSDGETVNGTLLFSGSPLEGVFDGAKDAELAFTAFVPKDARGPGMPPTLLVTLTAEGVERVKRSFRLGESESGPWHQLALELGEFAGREVRARFEISDEAEPSLCVVAEARVRRRGNLRTVLLVTSDTHRGDHLSVVSDDLVRTPAIDTLAVRGVLFENAFSASNTTNPSHVALMTGIHVRDTRVANNHTPLHEKAETLAERFRDAGYRTFAALSVTHLGPRESGLGQGFDRVYAPVDGESDGQLAVDVMTRWLWSAGDEPVFAWLHVFDAHSPYTPQASYDRRYYPSGKDPFDPKHPFDFPGKFLPFHLKGLRDVEFPHTQYRAEIDYVDDQLARIFSLKRVQGGIVAFTADHGESFGQHGVYWDHAELYPDSVHVPLILAWPGAPGGTQVSAPVRQLDLGRTLLNVADLDSADFAGSDLRDHLEGTPASSPRFALAGYGFSASINVGGWHLILHLLDHQPASVIVERRRHRVELYNRNVDPDCLRDLVDEEPERAREMRAALVRWLGDAGSEELGTRHEPTAEQRSRLAALGYGADASAWSAGDAWFDADCECEWCARFD